MVIVSSNPQRPVGFCETVRWSIVFYKIGSPSVLLDLEGVRKGREKKEGVRDGTSTWRLERDEGEREHRDV